MSDFADDANQQVELHMSYLLRNHKINASKDAGRDLEAETCNDCSLATKAAWGRSCESFVECRKDIVRHEMAKIRNSGKNAHTKKA